MPIPAQARSEKEFLDNSNMQSFDDGLEKKNQLISPVKKIAKSNGSEEKISRIIQAQKIDGHWAMDLPLIEIKDMKGA